MANFKWPLCPEKRCGVKRFFHMRLHMRRLEANLCFHYEASKGCGHPFNLEI